MAKKSAKKRLGRVFKSHKRQVVDVSAVADEHFEKHILRRFVRLGLVKRFIFGWLALVCLLIFAIILQIFWLNKFYLQTGPVPGGVFSEGIIGTYKNANPIYASGTVDSSVSRLVFSGLLKYNDNHRLVGDLARKWTLDKTERKYTVYLRPNVKWHDGKPFTAKDVVFTFKTVQNPDVRSPLQPSWKGIEITAKDDHTVVFELDSIFGAFPHSLTTGILPQHILKQIPPDQLRSNDFNNVEPVGTGPFVLNRGVEVIGLDPEERTERIGLEAYGNYHLGKPKLAQFVIRTFQDDQTMLKAYQDKEIDALVGLPAIPGSLANDSGTIEYGVPLTAEVLVFFRTSNDILADTSVRKALVLASNRLQVIKALDYPVLPADSPFLSLHNSYRKKLTQKTNKPAQANALLNKAGWKKDPKTGFRKKGGKELRISLYAQSTDEFSRVTKVLQEQWKKVGVNVEVILQKNEDLQTTASLHNYDAILSAVSIGSDPDVFAYWHSSQSDVRSQTRLNFSEYDSPKADQALEAGRARTDPRIRSAKYQPFLKAWIDDAPALALYQPRFLYIVRDPLHGLNIRSAVSAPDRFTNVHNWMKREALVPKKGEWRNW